MWMLRQDATETGATTVLFEEELGGQLKSYFGELTAGPVPDRLAMLTEALERALEQGQLSRCSLPRRG